MLRPHTIYYDKEIEDMASNVLISYKAQELKTTTAVATTTTATTTTATATTTTYLGNVLCIYCDLQSTDIHNFSISETRILKGNVNTDPNTNTDTDTDMVGLESTESSKVTIDVKYMESCNDNGDSNNLKAVLHLLKHLGKVDDNKLTQESFVIHSSNMSIGPSSSLIKISSSKNKSIYDIIVKCYPDHFNTDNSRDMIIQVGYAFEGTSSSSSSLRSCLGLAISIPSSSSSTPTTLVRMIRDIAIQTACHGHTDHFKVYSNGLNLSTLSSYQYNRQESLKDLYPYAYKDDDSDSCYNPLTSLLGPADF
jgi:hypothetical protein